MLVKLIKKGAEADIYTGMWNNSKSVFKIRKIKTYRKIEPYKGKGIREKGQYVLKKEGKKK